MRQEIDERFALSFNLRRSILGLKKGFSYWFEIRAAYIENGVWSSDIGIFRLIRIY